MAAFIFFLSKPNVFDPPRIHSKPVDLDAILEAYVEQGQSIESIIKNGFDEKIVRKIIRLVDLNEYKRNQAAPGIKTTPLAFGVGRRIPIVQKYRN